MTIKIARSLTHTHLLLLACTFHCLLCCLALWFCLGLSFWFWLFATCPDRCLLLDCSFVPSLGYCCLLLFYHAGLTMLFIKALHLDVTPVTLQYSNRKPLFISQCYSFYCIFNQINTALVSMRDFFQKALQTLTNTLLNIKWSKLNISLNITQSHRLEHQTQSQNTLA